MSIEFLYTISMTAMTPKSGNFLKFAIGLWLILALFTGALKAESYKLQDDPRLEIQPSVILDHLEENMSGIKDLKARMIFHIFIKQLGFPFSVDADYYFKSPDKVKILLHGLPGLISGEAPKTVTAATTLTGFRKDYQKLYHAKLRGIRKVSNQECYFLELTAINDGNVAKTFLWVNRQNYTIPQLITSYKDGSWIQVKRSYSTVLHHLLVNHIEASMNFTKSNLEADVTADYEKYSLNQGLKDSFFEEKKS